MHSNTTLFENKERFEKGFPADFIAEGVDQTRGWFYTLMVISTCLFDKPAFKSLIVNGLVLAEDGKKMSKSLRNYPDPNLVIDSQCADALRLYLINSPVVRAEQLKFSEKGVEGVVSGVLLPWFHGFRFFMQASKAREANTGAAFVPDAKVALSSKNSLDMWIIAAAAQLVKFVHQEMGAYRLYTVVPRLVDFIDQLTNWYMRFNRDRIKGVFGDEEAVYGLNVLYDVLMTMTLIMAPFTPFFSEYLYGFLRRFQPLYLNTDPSVPEDTIGKSPSVHFLMLPAVDESRLNQAAIDRFKPLQDAINLGRAARERRPIFKKSNFPAKNATVIVANAKDMESLEFFKSYFISEINVWNVDFTTDFSKNCTLKVVPDFRALGKRLGKDMKKVAAGINKLTQEEIFEFKNSGKMNICGYELTSLDLVTRVDYSGDTKKYEAAVSDDGSIMVAIDCSVEEENWQEYRAKQIVKVVNRLRKDAGLEVADQVEVYYEVLDKDAEAMTSCLNKHEGIILKKLKGLPKPVSAKKRNCQEIIKGPVDVDFEKLEITLTRATPSVNINAVKSLFANERDEAKREQALESAVMYIQTCDMTSLAQMDSVDIKVDGISILLKQGVHFSV